MFHFTELFRFCECFKTRFDVWFFVHFHFNGIEGSFECALSQATNRSSTDEKKTTKMRSFTIHSKTEKRKNLRKNSFISMFHIVHYDRITLRDKQVKSATKLPPHETLMHNGMRENVPTETNGMRSICHSLKINYAIVHWLFIDSVFSFTLCAIFVSVTSAKKTSERENT